MGSLSFVDGVLLGLSLALLIQWLLRETRAQRTSHPSPAEQPPHAHPVAPALLPAAASAPVQRPRPAEPDNLVLKSLGNWERIFLCAVRKSCDWENVSIVIRSLSSPPPPPAAGPTMLSIARWKSLCILDIKSQALRRRGGRWLGSDLDDGGSRSEGSSGVEEEEEEELYWRERENLITEGYPSELARPLTTYFPLQLLRSDHNKGFDVLTCAPIPATEDARASLPESQSLRRPSSLEDLGSTLNQLSKVAQEFVETEKLFVRDLQKLILLLNELRYSTLASVREFCQAVPFVGILSSAEVIQTVHSEFLNRIISCPSPLSETPPADVIVVDSLCHRILSSVLLYAPFFPLLAQYVVHHDSFSCLYNRYMSSVDDFNHFLGNSERLMGETMASLVIKPVQRLPRHVLLCNELKKIATKASEKARLSSADDLHQLTQTLLELTATCEVTCGAISGAAQSCNEIVRSYQDTLRMHDLHNQLLSGGSALSSTLPVVVKERRFIKEGDLYRHHKNSSMRLHRIQLFSDVILSSSPSATGSSLYLEQQIYLTSNSGTFCIPIPSPTLHRDAIVGSCTHWFLLGAQHKNLYFGCRSEAEMMRWVDAIQDCLIRNQAETDYGKFRQQLVLINNLLSDIDSYRSVLRKSSSSSISLQEFQTSWWHLLLGRDTAEILSHPSSTVPTALKRTSLLIHQHAKDVASHLILSIHCEDDYDLIEGRNPVQLLLFTEKPHFLIATGLFFEYSKSSASIATGDRPAVVRVFLFHDLLLAAYCHFVDAPLSYAFHMPLASLRCSDYRNEVGDLAILLEDSLRPRPITRRRSMMDRLKSFGDESQEVRRVLFAPTKTMKYDWLSLMMQALSSLSGPPEDPHSFPSIPTVRGRISLDLNPLKPLWIEAEDPSPSSAPLPPSEGN